MSKYMLSSILALILLAAACSDSGDKATEPTEDLPAISVLDYVVVEGGTALFVVLLDHSSTRRVIYSYATIGGSATVGADFTALSGTDSIAIGETEGSILVATIDDAVVESPETFSLALSAVSGAEVTDALATGTINDNETGLVSYESQVRPILRGHCAWLGFCHASTIAGGDMYIDTAATYSIVMNATGHKTGGKVVVPDSASRSTLYIVTTSAVALPFNRMPTMGQNPITVQQQNILRDWINQGAQDN